jgi:hypothetical protein
MRIGVECRNYAQLNTMSAHYNELDISHNFDKDTFTIVVNESNEKVGHCRTSFYDELDSSDAYALNKIITFEEWQKSVEPKSKEVKMKYVVEVNNHTEAALVRSSVGTTYSNNITTFPWCINGITGNMSEPAHYKAHTEHGPIIPFKTWAAMFDVEVRPTKILKLTDDYTAIVDYTKQVVNVGCQVIPFETVEKLAKLIKE